MTNFTKKFAVSFFPTDYQNSVVQGVSLSRTWYHQLTCTALGSEGSNFITNSRVIWLWTPRRQLTSWAAASGAPTEICSCIKHGTAELLPYFVNKQRPGYQGESCLGGPKGATFCLFPYPYCFDTWSFGQSIPMLDFVSAWGVTLADLIIPIQNN